MEQKLDIKTYAGTARKIGRDKIKRTITWIYRWGWSSREIIGMVAGDELRYAARLVKQGLLHKVEHPSGMLKSAYLLTETGFMMAVDEMADMLEFDGIPINYPWVSNRSRIAWTYFQHGLDIQKVMIGLGCHKQAYANWWASEREMRERIHRGALPDAMLENSDRITWIEVERNFKNEEQRSLQLWDRLEALKNRKFHEIRWVCATRGIALAVERALDAPFIPKTWRDAESSRIWREPSLGESLKPLREASKVSLLTEGHD